MQQTLTDHLLVPLIDSLEGVVRFLSFLTELLYGYFLLLFVFKVIFTSALESQTDYCFMAGALSVIPLPPPIHFWCDSGAAGLLCPA